MKKRIILTLLTLLAASMLLSGCSLIETLNKPIFKSGELDGTYVMTVDRPETEFTEAYTIDFLKLTITGKTGTFSRVSDMYLADCEQWATMRKLNQDPGEFPETEWDDSDKSITKITYDNFDYDWNLDFDGFAGATASEDKKTITIYSREMHDVYYKLVFKKR